MKAILLTILFAPIFSFSQSYKENQVRNYLSRLQYSGNERGGDQFNNLGNAVSAKELRDQGIRSVTIQRGKNEKKGTSVRYLLSESGLIERIDHPKDTIRYTYVNDSLIESIRQTGKRSSISLYEYKNGLLKKKEVFKNDRLSSRVFVDYTEEDKVAFSILQNGRKLKKSYVMNYDYEDGKVRRQEFVRNDRIVRTWDYSCEPKGEVVDVKTTSTICKFVEENNDGSYVNHSRKIEEGEVLLYSYYFDKDSVNYASHCEKETGEKVWSTTKEDNTRTSLSYDDKGRLIRTSVFTYNELDKLIVLKSTYGRKQKKESSIKYEYNTKGLLMSIISSYKGKVSYVRTYAYEK